MAYNVKLKKHANGELQLCLYSSPLVSKEPNYYEDDVERVIDGYERNPFDNKLSKIVDDLSELDVVRHATEEENERRSFNRTKNKIHDYSRAVQWEYFVTFTFNPEKVDRFDYDECSRLIRQWLHNQRRNAPELQYLIVPEMHKDGAWHFHGLLANVGKMKFKDSGKRTKDKQIIYNMGTWSYGFTTAIEIYNTHGASKYLCKYITKDLCKATKGKYRYFASNNLPTPEITTFLLMPDEDVEEFVQMIADSYGVEVVHKSSPRTNGAYVDVDYYELQEREL